MTVLRRVILLSGWLHCFRSGALRLRFIWRRWRVSRWLVEPARGGGEDDVEGDDDDDEVAA